jgi:hypothetical protein
MDENGTSPCDICGTPVDVPEEQRIGWSGGHCFDIQQGVLFVSMVRCRRHVHWTDPSFATTKAKQADVPAVPVQRAKPKPKKRPAPDAIDSAGVATAAPSPRAS